MLEMLVGGRDREFVARFAWALCGITETSCSYLPGRRWPAGYLRLPPGADQDLPR